VFVADGKDRETAADDHGASVPNRADGSEDL